MIVSALLPVCSSFSLTPMLTLLLILLSTPPLHAKPIAFGDDGPVGGITLFRVLSPYNETSSADFLHERNLREQIVLPSATRLTKRGNCFSQKDGDSDQGVELEENPVFQCSTQIPSVDECADKIRSRGQVAVRPSMFYNSYYLDDCERYFQCNKQRFGNVVSWDNMVDGEWLQAQGKAIQLQEPNPGSHANEVEQFQRRVAQAFGQEAQGIAYICIPDDVAPDNIFDQNKAWGGWEFPALTRNSKITSVVRVDYKNDNPRPIWRKGDPPTPNEPKG